MSIINLNFVSNAGSQTGVGHYAAEIAKRLKKMPEFSLTEWEIQGKRGKLLKDGMEVASVRSWPGGLGSKSINWVRLGRKIKREQERQDPQLFHLTNQSLSFLAHKVSPSIITVHDLIELLEPQDWKAKWLNAFLYGGISKANHIICVSEYTKKTVQEHCNVPEDKITVIPNGVGPEFHPLPNFERTIGAQTLNTELKITSGAKIVLYVGSDHPRKNLVTAVRALARAQREIDTPLIFIKVGSPGLPAGREQFLQALDEHHLREAVRIVETVSLERLNELYNLADVLIYPSSFEGFGLPPLQAMAAGTPVITSNATSLPEIVGRADLMHDPHDFEKLSQALVKVLTNEEYAAELSRAGQQRAKEFSWEVAAQKTYTVYANTLS